MLRVLPAVIVISFLTVVRLATAGPTPGDCDAEARMLLREFDRLSSRGSAEITGAMEHRRTQLRDAKTAAEIFNLLTQEARRLAADDEFVRQALAVRGPLSPGDGLRFAGLVEGLMRGVEGLSSARCSPGQLPVVHVPSSERGQALRFVADAIACKREPADLIENLVERAAPSGQDLFPATFVEISLSRSDYLLLGDGYLVDASRPTDIGDPRDFRIGVAIQSPRPEGQRSPVSPLEDTTYFSMTARDIVSGGNELLPEDVARDEFPTGIRRRDGKMIFRRNGIFIPEIPTVAGLRARFVRIHLPVGCTWAEGR